MQISWSEVKSQLELSLAQLSPSLSLQWLNSLKSLIVQSSPFNITAFLIGVESLEVIVKQAYFCGDGLLADENSASGQAKNVQSSLQILLAPVGKSL